MSFRSSDYFRRSAFLPYWRVYKSSRSEIASLINSKGGFCKDGITKDTNYLVIGSDGNPCWAFACYGRKVEKAVQMRKEGIPIAIVNEVDFWDALQS